jgi:hypothetical protein
LVPYSLLRGVCYLQDSYQSGLLPHLIPFSTNS